MTQEQWQLSRFTEILGVEGKIEYSDSPDLLIHQKRTVIGVEHTRLIHSNDGSSDLRAFEKVMGAAVRRAQQSFDEKAPGELHVWVHANSRVRVGKKDVPSIAQGIEEVVRAFAPEENGSMRAGAWECRQFGIALSKAIHSIYVLRHSGIKRSCWTPAWGGFMPHLTVDVIRSQVRRKEKRLKAYLRQCDETWLLLVVENFAPSASWDLDNVPLDYSFESNFDRLFIYDMFSAQVVELMRHAP